ncbi:Ribosomal protein S12p Asp88 (E. coli) methylthiotransferase [hydrothermal vent metagenome]|uniref:Ribosomal protein S12p Asp88 (E. coli) methylthiotransferase n=1 Tax=hydrothermal vent metagenome TaxID=652676 RepID=A0A3B1BBT6_9ZZZZ
MADTPCIGFISLGCPKALVDSERILTQLQVEGYAISASYEGADLVIVNTCGFIDAAIEESLEAIGEALEEQGRVIVTGCLGVNEDEVRKAHPAVLAVTGPHAYAEVMTAVHKHAPAPRHPFSGLLPEHGIKLTPRHYAYLKISEGCSHRCRFCIIPDLRGDLVSRPIGAVMQEAESLVNAGVRELLVVAQDTGAYGIDLNHRPDFWHNRPLSTHIQTLTDALGDLPAWIRLHYVYPYPHVDDLIPLMTEEKILPYLDIPLQHANRRVLQAMRRPAAAEKMLERIQQWREICPNITLRSTFITGFPGETETEFKEMLDFLQEAQLDRVGCFAYSPVAGATANKLPDQIPEEIKEERLERFMAVQAEISREKLAAKVGRRMTVLVDEVHPNESFARSAGEAPEIDGWVIIEGGWDLEPGDFIEVDITGSSEHDLWGEPIQS